VQLDEVRMTNTGERAELLLESIQRRRLEPRERLQRDVRTTLAIANLVDDAEAARPDAADDLETRRTGELSRQIRSRSPLA
jgi:hypothetical protein